MARRCQEIDALSTNGDEEWLGDNKEKYADVSTTKQFEDRILLVSKQKNFNAMDSFNKPCYLLQRECLGRIAIWITSNDLLREKRRLLTRIKSHKKDFIRPRTKWRKASESAYPTNALGSIVLLLSLLNLYLVSVLQILRRPK
ncbi:LOW QUALITY PROTEIN: hypothetical protein YC2023_033304 [Brassica napus]